MTSLADTHTARQTSDGVDGSGVGPEDPELALAVSAGSEKNHGSELGSQVAKAQK